MDKSTFFSSLGGYLRANKAFFISIFAVIAVVGGYFWWQNGFTLEIGKFFAYNPDGHYQCVSQSCQWSNTGGDDECSTDQDCGAPACGPVPPAQQTCQDDDCDDDGAKNPAAVGGTDCDDGNSCVQGNCPLALCGNGTCEGNENQNNCPGDCGEPTSGYTCGNQTGQFCYTGPNSCPNGTSSVNESCSSGICCQAAISTQPASPSPTATTTSVPAGGCPSGYTKWDDNVCWKITATPGLSTESCQSAGGGNMCQTWDVYNYGSGDYTVVLNGFHDEVTSCQGTTAGGSGGTSIQNGSFSPGSHHTVTVCYDGTRHDCGRVQVDACIKNESTGNCRDENGGLALGSVITYPGSCVAPTPSNEPTPTPTPTPTYSATPTPTPTPSVSVTPTPSTSPTPTPSISPALSCTGSLVSTTVGQTVQFSAQGGVGPYTWYAPSGSPFTALGTPFTVSYTSSGFKTVTVVSGGQQASCTVTITLPSISSTPPPTCTPAICSQPPEGCTYQNAGACSCGTLVCPSTPSLVCAPTNQTVGVNQVARFDVAGWTSRTFSWSAPGASPGSATGPNQYFETEYRASGNYVVTVSSGGQTAQCRVTVSSGGSSHLECRNNTCARVSGSGSNECSSEGSSCGGSGSTPRLAIEKLVRNVTQSSAEQDGVTANPSNTVEFSIRVSSTGSSTVTSATVRDALPAGLAYVAGSTTIDGVAASDGIVSSGLNLGNMPSGRSITVRFRATVSSAAFFSTGTTVLTNTAYARGSNVSEVSDTAFVTVMNNSSNIAISLTKMGRNISRGDTAEVSPVRASGAQTIEFVMRVRNTTSTALTNVVIRDILPSEITLIAGTVRVDGVTASDVLTAAGLSLGTLSSGQEVRVTFSGLVAPVAQLPAGTTTVINTVTVSASGVPTISAQLPIIISNGGVVIPPVETGPGETTVLALIISAIITLLYVGYTSTDSYRRQEAGAIARDSRTDTSDFNR